MILYTEEYFILAKEHILCKLISLQKEALSSIYWLIKKALRKSSNCPHKLKVKRVFIMDASTYDTKCWLRIRAASPEQGLCANRGRIERLAAPTVEILPFPDRHSLLIRSDLKFLRALHHEDLLHVHTVPSSVKSNVESKPNKHSLHSLELCLWT